MSDLRDKNDQPRNGLLGGAKRVIIKVGTSTVTGSEGQLFLERIEPIVRSIAALHTSRQIVLVSSGAVGLGRGWLGLHPSRLKDMATKQACAAEEAVSRLIVFISKVAHLVRVKLVFKI